MCEETVNLKLLRMQREKMNYSTLCKKTKKQNKKTWSPCTWFTSLNTKLLLKKQLQTHAHKSPWGGGGWGGWGVCSAMGEKNQDMSYSCSYSPPDDTGDIFQSWWEKQLYFKSHHKKTRRKKMLAVVMRRNVAGLTPTLQIVHWEGCLTVEWFQFCNWVICDWIMLAALQRS